MSTALTPQTTPQTTTPETTVLSRRRVVARILRDRTRDVLVIASLGNPSYDVAAAGDLPQNFYLWGAMGSAVMFGLGLARAQPGHRVVAFAGDGEMLMALGSLATIGVDQPANLAIVVIDNERYAETGMQPTHTGRGVDIAAIARGAGIRNARLVRCESELEESVDTIMHGEGPVLVTIKVGTEPEAASLPPRDGPYLRSRFREALLGDSAHASQ